MASASSSSAAASRAPKLTCLCSPTNHPGSFRCSRHRNNPRGRHQAPSSAHQASGEAPGHGQQHRGGGRASAAANKGRSVRALLLQKIASSPSDRDRQQRRRRGDFQPRPSRLRLMNK